MISIAVCENEYYSLAVLESKIQMYMRKKGLLYQLHSFTKGESLLDAKIYFDIVFLDMKMDGLDGASVAKSLNERGNCRMIVFVAELSEREPSALTAGSADYLTKPIDDKKLRATFDRFLDQGFFNCELFLLFKKGHSYGKLLFKHIVYCEVINRKVYLHTKQGVIDYYEKLETLAKQLHTGFFRCHRSFIVNLRYVDSFQDNMILTHTNDRIPIAKTKKSEFAAAMSRLGKES